MSRKRKFFWGVGNFYRGFIALFRRRRQQQQQQQPSKQKHHHQTKHTKRLLHCMDVATKRISIPFLSFCEVLWLGSFPTKLILASWTAFDTCQCGCANLIELLIWRMMATGAYGSAGDVNYFARSSSLGHRRGAPGGDESKVEISIDIL